MLNKFATHVITALIAFAAITFCFSAHAEVSPGTLYATSFEKLPQGAFKSLKDDDCEWKASGKSGITSKFAYTGTQSLHIYGGAKNQLELELKNQARKARGVVFQAERWTGRKPFELRLFAKYNRKWHEIAELDELVRVGRGFQSKIILKLPEERIEALRFVSSTPEKSGVLIDDFKLLKEQPANETKPPKVCETPIKKVYDKHDLFVSGTADTHTFRIPALITAANGDLIACCDARRNSGADLKWVRDIDIVIKRSTDNGKTWGPMETVIDYGDKSVGKPASDPSFILDRETEEIFCFYNFMDQDKAKGEFRLHVQSSKDHGKTWSEPRDITDEITHPSWKKNFKFITSGRGIQRRNGELLHTIVNLQKGLFLFGSKDHGKSWHYINTSIRPADESKVIELTDRSLMVNSRINGKGFRGVHRSRDEGKSWEFEVDSSQVDPGCNGSILRYTSKADGYKKDRLLLCHANSKNGRKNLVVKISYDEGLTWSEGKVIDPGASAYSSLSICKDGSIGILYEPGYKSVRFVRITLADLTDGKDKLAIPYKPAN